MKKYTEMMEHIRPTDCRKNKMLEKAFENSERLPKRRFKFKYLAVLTAAAMIFSTTTVFADDIKEMFYNLLGKNELVSEDVLNDIFSDDDGHVKITVKELLSDGVNSYAIVEYTALDEKGKWWIDKPLVLSSENDLSLHINYPMLDANNNYSSSNGVEELKEYHTENSRIFRLTCFAADKSHNNSVRLIYNLHDKWKSEAVLDVSESVEFKYIKIDNSLAPKKSYEPVSYRISPLGLIVYGNDLQMTKVKKNLIGGYHQQVVKSDSLKSLYLVMKDGKTHDMLNGDDELSSHEFTCMCVYDIDDQPYNASLFSGAFPKPVDVNTIAGIELDGVYYPIDAENPQ